MGMIDPRQRVQLDGFKMCEEWHYDIIRFVANFRWLPERHKSKVRYVGIGLTKIGLIRGVFVRALLLIIACVVVTGCSTTLPVNYVASPSLKGSGTVAVGKFEYVAFENGDRDANQFQKVVSIGEMYIDKDVSKLMAGALNKELIASGFTVENTGDLKISGDIDKFLYDWTGFTETDMYLDVTYKVTKSGKPVYSKSLKSHKALPKMPGFESEAIRGLLSDNIDQLFSDLRDENLL